MAATGVRVDRELATCTVADPAKIGDSPSDSNPASVKESAAPEQQHHEDDDEQCGRVHVLSLVF
jgi:hypothetical protein